ncbi:hypothetical protein [Actinoplanes palleronii]|uniref:Uncharacterized protein n=1 Tax=Actinoplanes palleronii TaxID=113570 RepID=A0ABQ4BT66_9ACTN|nr:hypothetical protein [Actinoplanes palleronii]GIE73867.1 hypothetical protein Apa02nite_099750 [Actinoplanes palleronii]
MNMLTRVVAAAVGVIAGAGFGVCPAPAVAADCKPGDCVTPGAGDAVRQPIPYIYIGVSKYPCGALQSRQVDRTEVALSVSNRSRVPLILYWRTTLGSRDSARALPPGSSVSYTSYRGHAWEVASSTGTCLSQFVITDDSTRAVITYS